MKITCHKCKHIGKPIIKMGGILCSKCRVIVMYSSDPEYQEALRKGGK